LDTTGITVCRSTGIQWNLTNSQPGETGRTSLCDPLLDYWIGGTYMLTARETFSMQGCRFPLISRLPRYLLPLNAICRCLTRSGLRQRISWGGCLGSCVFLTGPLLLAIDDQPVDPRELLGSERRRVRLGGRICVTLACL